MRTIQTKDKTKALVIEAEDLQPKPEKEVTGNKLLMGYFGIFFVVIGFLVLLPLTMLIFYHDPETEQIDQWIAFFIPGICSIVIGLLLSLFIFRKKQGRLTPVQDLVLLIGVWILAIAISAIPYAFYGYNFNQAIFESTSGYTSAGLTIMDWNNTTIDTIRHLKDGTTQPWSHMLFFHRALTELVGGIGLILVVASAISEQSGLNIYLLEGHNDRLLPNLAKSARLIFSIYLGIILFGTILYLSVGVDPFDAVTHSMTAVATGGFSTKANNINTLVYEVSLNGAWRGICTEVITEILMLLGGTNFYIHFALFRGKWKAVRHYEFWVMLGVLVVIWPFMIAGMSQYYGNNFLAGLRYGTFEMISGLSTCGFQAIDSYQGHALDSFAGYQPGGMYGYSPIANANNFVPGAEMLYQNGTFVAFPTYLLVLLGICMMIGMQAGSTTGAIKMNRVGLFCINIWDRVLNSIGVPEAKRVRTVYKYGQKVRVNQKEVSEAGTFIGMYVFLVLVGTTLMSAITYGYQIPRGDGTGNYFTWTDCFFEFTSSIGTVGLGCGITHFNTLPGLLWIEIIGMMLGRLEIFCFFILAGKIGHNIMNHRFIYRLRKRS